MPARVSPFFVQRATSRLRFSAAFTRFSALCLKLLDDFTPLPLDIRVVVYFWRIEVPEVRRPRRTFFLSFRAGLVTQCIVSAQDQSNGESQRGTG